MSGGSYMLLRKIYPVCCKQDLDIGQHQWLDWYKATLIYLMLFCTMISLSEGKWQHYLSQGTTLQPPPSHLQHLQKAEQTSVQAKAPAIVLNCGKLLREAKKWYPSTLLLEAWGCVFVWVRLAHHRQTSLILI